MKVYRRGYKPPGAITKASCRRIMPKPPKTKGAIKKGGVRSQGITTRQCGEAAGRLMKRPGVHIGTSTMKLPPGLNLKAYANVMRGAGYAIKIEDLRKLQRRG